MKGLLNKYKNLPLLSKIRYSYLALFFPAVIFALTGIAIALGTNARYENMIEAATVASSFSLDFKKDFDYETYLLIVENKSIEESSLDELLKQATAIVDELEQTSDDRENDARLRSVKKYIQNLNTYKTRIEDNLREGNKYEENIEIWENDVQIVTTLLRESMMEYIYYEIQDMQQSREEYQRLYLHYIIGATVIFVILLAGMIAMSIHIPQSITRPILHLSEVTEQVAKGDLSVRADIEYGEEVKVLGESLNTMIDKINELLSQVTEEQIRLRNAELELLQAQINPHFLYNTLDTIVWLAEVGDREKVVSMVESLSNFFRTSLSRGKEVVPLSEELLHVRSYLAIQQVRYQDILEYEIEVPQEMDHCDIPKITLQPLVENALYHGIKNKRRKGKITISGYYEGDKAYIIVSDNGIGMEPERLAQVRQSLITQDTAAADIYGVYNVNERIRLKFGEEYGIEIESVYDEGTTVRISLPKEI